MPTYMAKYSASHHGGTGNIILPVLYGCIYLQPGVSRIKYPREIRLAAYRGGLLSAPGHLYEWPQQNTLRGTT